LALSGSRQKGLDLARALGMPQYVVIDAGHQAGRRLRDYIHFDDPDDPRNALLVECGQHWEAVAPIVAQQVMLRFLRHFDMRARQFCDAHVDAGETPPQSTIAITDVVTIETNAFEFAGPVTGMMTI